MPASEEASSGALRQRIFDEATRLFAERGYAATSIRDITEASGCTRPSLYYYFNSKEELFRVVVEHRLQLHEKLVRALVDGEGSLRHRLHENVERFIDAAIADPMGMRLIQRVETRPEESLDIDIMAARRHHLETLTGAIEKSIEAGEIRRDTAPFDCSLLLAGTISFQCELSLAQGQWSRDQFHRTIDLVFDGIAFE